MNSEQWTRTALSDVQWRSDLVDVACLLSLSHPHVTAKAPPHAPPRMLDRGANPAIWTIKIESDQPSATRAPRTSPLPMLRIRPPVAVGARRLTGSGSPRSLLNHRASPSHLPPLPHIARSRRCLACALACAGKAKGENRRLTHLVRSPPRWLPQGRRTSHCCFVDVVYVGVPPRTLPQYT